MKVWQCRLSISPCKIRAIKLNCKTGLSMGSGVVETVGISCDSHQVSHICTIIVDRETITSALAFYDYMRSEQGMDNMKTPEGRSIYPLFYNVHMVDVNVDLIREAIELDYFLGTPEGKNVLIYVVFVTCA